MRAHEILEEIERLDAELRALRAEVEVEIRDDIKIAEEEDNEWDLDDNLPLVNFDGRKSSKISKKRVYKWIKNDIHPNFFSMGKHFWAETKLYTIGIFFFLFFDNE